MLSSAPKISVCAFPASTPQVLSPSRMFCKNEGGPHRWKSLPCDTPILFSKSVRAPRNERAERLAEETAALGEPYAKPRPLTARHANLTQNAHSAEVDRQTPRKSECGKFHHIGNEKPPVACRDIAAAKR